MPYLTSTKVFLTTIEGLTDTLRVADPFVMGSGEHFAHDGSPVQLVAVTGDLGGMWGERVMRVSARAIRPVDGSGQWGTETERHIIGVDGGSVAFGSWTGDDEEPWSSDDDGSAAPFIIFADGRAASTTSGLGDGGYALDVELDGRTGLFVAATIAYLSDLDLLPALPVVDAPAR